MARTSTEELIRQLKRSEKSKGILVPKIEKYMRNPVEIDDDEDREYLAKLIEARSQPRTGGVYSPSMLASCVRQVYFIKTGQPFQKVGRVESSGFFLDGNFRHFKWQYLMWKLHRAGIIKLVDVGSICLGAEIPVRNQSGDVRGTIDNLVQWPNGKIRTIDWKGMNGNGFNRSVASGPGIQYIMQSVGYANLANYCLHERIKLHPGIYHEGALVKVDSVLIIGENKNGPMNTRLVKAPLGLLEWEIPVKEYLPLVQARIKKLRSFERRQIIPPAECISIHQMKFKECPFSGYCRGEIEKTMSRKIKKAKKRNVEFIRKRK